MSLLDLLSDESSWKTFYEYKSSLCRPKQETEELRVFISEKKYLPVCEGIRSGGRFSLPKRSVISKLGTAKKRVVYTYPKAENTVLKLLTFLMIRKYNGIFSGGLYSFRPHKTAKDAIRSFLKLPGIENMYSYKVDIHDYFNSVPVDKLLPMLKDVLSDDPELYDFLKSLLCEKYVLERGEAITEEKGIMAGTPLSTFYANLYLSGLDRYFEERRIPYARYSDDIIAFAGTEEKTKEYAENIKGFLSDTGLAVNPAKELFSAPPDGWVFLGFSVNGKTVDIAPATVKKLKQKMKRKTNALKRWADRSGTERTKAAKAFIRIFNRKLLESPENNDLSWSFWFFPVINTDKSLHEIEIYAQQCIRYLISGKRTKSAYNVRYEDMKALGYKSLVHEFYDFPENGNESQNN